MGVEQFNVPPLNFSDPAVLEKALGNIDPVKVLGDLGLNSNEVKQVLDGNYEAVKDHTEKPRLLEFEKIYDSYLKDMNSEVIKSFFEHAKTETPFTQDEVEAFSETYSLFFKRCFDDFYSLSFRYEGHPDTRCLLIKVSGSVYQLSIFEGVGQITCLQE